MADSCRCFREFCVDGIKADASNFDADETLLSSGISAAPVVDADGRMIGIVREADLTWNLRVIKPTEGIPSYSFDPNRLTLVLSEDGRIVDAAWD